MSDACMNACLKSYTSQTSSQCSARQLIAHVGEASTPTVAVPCCHGIPPKHISCYRFIRGFHRFPTLKGKLFERATMIQQLGAPPAAGADFGRVFFSTCYGQELDHPDRSRRICPRGSSHPADLGRSGYSAPCSWRAPSRSGSSPLPGNVGSNNMRDWRETPCLFLHVLSCKYASVNIYIYM